ncbi:MAG: S-layer homology domain-containing protein [Solirubrobacterales bacterium]
MRRITSFFVLLLFLFGLAAPVLGAVSFKDVGKIAERDDILLMASKGIIKGYPDGTFKPNTPMSNSTFVVALMSALSIKPSSAGTSSFTDTKKHWASSYINEAVRLGILVPSEYPKGQFNPNSPIKRSQAAAMMVRGLGLQPDTALSTFKDRAQVEKSMYRGYIKTAYDQGLMPLAGNNEFRPFDVVTRAKACVFISQLIDKAASLPPVQPPSGTSPAAATPTVPAKPPIVVGSQITSVVINGVPYAITSTPIYVRLGLNDIKVASLIKSGTYIVVNQMYQFALANPNGNPDFTVFNTRYNVSSMTISENSLLIAASARRIGSLTVDKYKYNAEYSHLYINGRNGELMLSDAQITGTTSIKINDTAYNLAIDNITLELGNRFYLLKQVTLNANGESVPDLAEVPATVLRHPTLSDISAVHIGSTVVNSSTLTKLYFIIDAKKYDLYDITFDTAGYFTAGNQIYRPDQVLMVSNGNYYKLSQLALYADKYLIYCSETSVSTMLKVDDVFTEMSKVQILKNGQTYKMDDVAVVSRNVLRFGGTQVTLSSDIKLRYDGKVFDIDWIDYDSTLNMISIEPGKESSAYAATTQPTKYLFTLDGGMVRDGVSSDVYVLAGASWIAFSKIVLNDATRYTSNSTVYDFMTSRIKIANTEYIVIDTVWRGKSQTFELVLQKL